MGLNTSVYGSCSAQLNGEMFVFGGSNYDGNDWTADYDKQVKNCYKNSVQFKQWI